MTSEAIMERTEWPGENPREASAADQRIDDGRVAFQRPERGRRGPKNYQRSDERILEDVSERILHSAHVDASEVTVTVRDGIVTLEGTVPELWMKHAIENISFITFAVVDVENRIKAPRRTR
jgi:osmotically-inducible protein OsmY